MACAGLSAHCKTNANWGVWMWLLILGIFDLGSHSEGMLEASWFGIQKAMEKIGRIKINKMLLIIQEIPLAQDGPEL